MVSIEKLKEKVNNLQSKRKTILTQIKKAEEELQQTFSDCPIYADSNKITLDSTGPDGGYYGFISFNGKKINVASRHTDDDLEDFVNKTLEEYKSYHVQHYTEVDVGWLDRIFSKKLLKSLFESLSNNLDGLNEDADEAIMSTDKIINGQSDEINKDTEKTLQDFGTKELYADWEGTRRKISEDPAESITRTYSYLESLCRTILSSKGRDFPSNSSMSKLVNMVIDEIKISVDKQSEEDLKQLFGNIKGFFKSTEDIRSHFGTAHGSSPNDKKLLEKHARFLNNCAGAVSSFILESSVKI